MLLRLTTLEASTARPLCLPECCVLPTFEVPTSAWPDGWPWVAGGDLLGSREPPVLRGGDDDFRAPLPAPPPAPVDAPTDPRAARPVSRRLGLTLGLTPRRDDVVGQKVRVRPWRLPVVPVGCSAWPVADTGRADRDRCTVARPGRRCRNDAPAPRPRGRL